VLKLLALLPNTSFGSMLTACRAAQLAACVAVASFLPTVQAQSKQCVEMYTTAFKDAKKKTLQPSEVGKVYLQYCKKNMRVGSAKSMDELCQPIVKKVEDKMIWVPTDFEVSPELVCKTLDQIKEQFPEHAASMAEGEATRKKEESAEEAQRKQLAGLAKSAGAKIEQDIVDVLKKALDTASTELKGKLVAHVNEANGALGGGAWGKKEDKFVSSILESISLGIRGVETKAKQKKQEVLQEWLVAKSKELKKKTEL